MSVATRADLYERIDAFARQPEKLIGVLHLVQAELGHVPTEMQERIATALEVPISQVYGVVTFYDFFRTEPVGEHTIRLCQGTACHVRGADRILTALQTRLGVSPGETTEDLAVTLETVACLGACALSPVMVVDGVYHGLLTLDEAVAIVDRTIEEAG